MPENMDTKTIDPEKSSHSTAPFAAPNLPKPVRQSYVAQGYGTETLAHAIKLIIEFLKKCFIRLDTDKNRELGEAAARTAAEGFCNSFAGVTCAISDLKDVIDKKSPRSAAILDQAGETAKTLGQKMKTAGAEVVPKLKDLRESEGLDIAKGKIVKYAIATDHVISAGAEGAGKGLKKVAQGTGVLIGGLKDKAVAKIEERRAEKSEDDSDNKEEEINSAAKTGLEIAKAALDKAGEKIQSLNQSAGTGVPSDHGASGFSKKIDEHLNKLGVIVPQKTVELTKLSFVKAGEKIRSLNQSAGTGVPSDHGASGFSKKIDEQLNKLGVIVPQKTVELTKTSFVKAGEKIQSLNQAAGTGIPTDHGASEFSKKIDEHLNKFGTFVSKKSGNLTKGLLGKAGEKIHSIRHRVGTSIPENFKKDDLQKKLSENIKNLGDTVTKKNAEDQIKKYAAAFSDKAKTLADSARQKAESIRKSDADQSAKIAELSEKIDDFKGKVAESARDLTEYAKDKIDAIRSQREVEPAKDGPVKNEPTLVSTSEPINSDPEPNPESVARKTRAQVSNSAAKARAVKTGTRPKPSTSTTKSRGRSTSDSPSVNQAPKGAAKRAKSQDKAN